MYKRKEAGDFIWIFPLISGICSVVAILTPTASYSMFGVSWSWWMWDFSLMTYIGYPPLFFFISEIDFIIPSIITTSAMLLSTVNLFILSSTTRKRKLLTKDFTLMSLISALLTIGIMIYYAFSVALAFNDGLLVEGVEFPPGYHFWSEFNPSFGLILPYISAILSFVGLGLFRHYTTRRGVFVPLKESYPPEIVSTPPKPKSIVEATPILVSKEGLNYCPECGHKLIRPDANFCTNCGFKF
ncbi:MAG: zinc ribbon domain-containing protein [Candidatus Hermodarchaeota archaeon]